MPEKKDLLVRATRRINCFWLSYLLCPNDLWVRAALPEIGLTKHITHRNKRDIDKHIQFLVRFIFGCETD